MEHNGRNFEDHIRNPSAFGMTDRYGSSEDAKDRIIFPDDPIFSSGENRKPVREAKADEKLVFPADRPKSSDVTDGANYGEGAIDPR